MDATAGPAGSPSSTSKPTRGKDQLSWGDDVWKMIDQAVSEEMTRSTMGTKFLPLVYVHKKRTTIDADIVVPPMNPLIDPSLSVAEATTKRIQQFMAQIRLSRAQVDAEGESDAELSGQIDAKSSQASTGNGQSAIHRPHRASTAVSLGLQAARLHAQLCDLVVFTGGNAVAYHPLFTTNLVQALDPNLLTNLDGGLLNILPSTSTSTFQPLPPSATPANAATMAVANVIQLPPAQVVLVHPTVPGTPAAPSPRYAENSLNAAAQSVAIAQANGYIDNYALVLPTYPYAEIHEALKDTLIQPVEPMSHIISNVLGTPNLPPFPAFTSAGVLETTASQSLSTGLPTHILAPTTAAPSAIVPIATLPGFAPGTNVLYAGFLVSLSGNSMDVVRGLMDDGQDVCMTFNQKSANEQYLFNLSQRFALRLKDPLAVVLLLYLDQ